LSAERLLHGGLQKIGRALMLPIAVLPAAALLLRFGQREVLTAVGVPADLQPSFVWLTDAAEGIFRNLPLLFAVGVGAGLANAAAAGVSAAIGYWMFTAVLVDVSKIAYGDAGAHVSMGVLAGLLTGLVAATLHRRYHDVQLGAWLAFFSGERLVPLLTAVIAVVGGAVFGLLWYWPEAWLARLGHWVVGQGALGAGIHALLNRLLLPFGLHHVMNGIVWYEYGDLTRFASTAGREGGVFTTGFFPTMMFGLPGAALAIVRTARPENRRVVGGLLLSGAVTSLLTGVTEPVEFAFMFAAPLLYVLHAALAGLGAFLAVALGCRDGFSFSAGLVDYVLNYDVATRPLALLAVGVALGVLYYTGFVALIRALNLATPGREGPLASDQRSEPSSASLVSAMSTSTPSS
jgi:N-acetylglucosamine PTS system EIICBA or EIICB component